MSNEQMQSPGLNIQHAVAQFSQHLSANLGNRITDVVALGFINVLTQILQAQQPPDPPPEPPKE